MTSPDSGAAVDDFDDALEQQSDAAATGQVDPAAEAAKWKALARKHEQAAKANASAAKKLAEIEDRNKSEAQKLEERAAAAEGLLGPIQQENARLRVALAKGLPADLVDRLRGGTEDELAADADKLLQLVGQQAPAGGSFDGGARRTAPPVGDMNSLIRQQVAARRGA